MQLICYYNLEVINMNNNSLIKNRRLELHLTLEEVAKKVGVTKATVQRWESGLIENMRRDKIALLADALKTTPSFILGIEQEQTTDKDKIKCTDIKPNTIVFFGRGEGRKEYVVSDKEMQALKNLIETFKDLPDEDNF